MDTDRALRFAPELPPADVPLVFLDTETTHLDRRKRRIWDIAVIRHDPDGGREQFTALVDDVDLTDASEESLNVGHFYQRHPAHRRRPAGGEPQDAYPTLIALPEAQIAPIVAELTRDAHLVGICPSFDEHSLFEMLDRHGLITDPNGEAPWHYHLIDAATLACGLLGQQPAYTSRQLSDRVGVHPGLFAEHTAIGDALWAEALYLQVMRARPRMEANLAAYDQIADWVRRYTPANPLPGWNPVPYVLEFATKGLPAVPKHELGELLAELEPEQFPDGRPMHSPPGDNGDFYAHGQLDVLEALRERLHLAPAAEQLTLGVDVAADGGSEVVVASATGKRVAVTPVVGRKGEIRGEPAFEVGESTTDEETGVRTIESVNLYAVSLDTQPGLDEPREVAAPTQPAP